MCPFSQYYLNMCLLFTFFLKKIQQNILETYLTAKVIVSIIFSIKNIVFLKLLVIIMSEDTPECAKLHTLKKSFCGNMLPNHLAMCSKTKRPQIPLKIVPQ